MDRLFVRSGHVLTADGDVVICEYGRRNPLSIEEQTDIVASVLKRLDIPLVCNGVFGVVARIFPGSTAEIAGQTCSLDNLSVGVFPLELLRRVHNVGDGLIDRLNDQRIC